MEVGIGLDLLIHPHICFASFSVLFWEESHPEKVGPEGYFEEVSFSFLILESDDSFEEVSEDKADVPLFAHYVGDYVYSFFFVWLSACILV